MTGLNEFIKTFGNITISDVITFLLALVFLVLVYHKISKYLVQRYEANKEKDEQLKEALDGVKKIPEFEKQLLEFIASQEDQTKRLVKIEEDSKRRERNKLRDRLLQSYRYYTSLEYNPRKEWTRMESEAFWELFSDYEEADGNGYVHTEIQPAMNLLTIIEISDVNRISLLMQSRK